MPEEIYDNEEYGWQPETRKIFKNWTSGQLADPTVNYWSPEHIAYNDGVKEIIYGYLKKNNISSKQVTPAQAREIVEEVLGSSDPRIGALRLKIFHERWRYLRVYGVDRWRGGGGDEE